MRHPLVAIVLFVAFAAQLVLSGASAACVMPETGDAAAPMSNDRAMAAMPMGAGTHEREHASRAPDEEKNSCDTQLPAAACQLMSACTVAGFPVSSSVAAAGTHLPSGAIPFLRASPPLRTTAPELPPPRA